MAFDHRADLYPCLKSGVTLTRTEEGILLALPTHGLHLSAGLHIQLARNLDGARNVRELAATVRCSPDEIHDFADLLLREGLIDLLSTPQTSAPIDLSSNLIETRSGIERSLLAHRLGVHDGGVEELRAREEVTLLISGENRIGRHLLLALQASGFTKTRLISRAGLPPRISEGDICGIALRASDIGKLRRECTEELIRNAQIARSETKAKNFPDLIISTIPIEWDYAQRWMSEGSAHLHINQILGRSIEIGPLVVPGVTPCLRCVALTKRENGALVDYDSLRSEAPSAAAAFISGLVALAVAEYVAMGQSPLVASSRWYDLLSPTQEPEVRHWNFHPECGCR